MPLIEEISTDSYSSVEVNTEACIAIAKQSEILEIQSEGISLCFIEKQGTETENEGFISDSLERFASDGETQIFSKQISFQDQSCVSVIEEIDSQSVADSKKEWLLCENAHNPDETDLHVSISVATSENLAKEEDIDNSSICKFCACSDLPNNTILQKLGSSVYLSVALFACDMNAWSVFVAMWFQ